MTLERIFVYFILNLTTQELKIGQSKYPYARLKQLEQEEKAPLVLLGMKEDVIPLEKKLHSKFSHLHSRGEWFKLEGDLVDYVQQIHKASTLIEVTSPPTHSSRRKEIGPFENDCYLVTPLPEGTYRVECKLCDFSMTKPIRKSAILSGNSHYRKHCQDREDLFTEEDIAELEEEDMISSDLEEDIENGTED